MKNLYKAISNGYWIASETWRLRKYNFLVTSTACFSNEKKIDYYVKHRKKLVKKISGMKSLK